MMILRKSFLQLMLLSLAVPSVPFQLNCLCLQQRNRSTHGHPSIKRSFCPTVVPATVATNRSLNQYKYKSKTTTAHFALPVVYSSYSYSSMQWLPVCESSSNVYPVALVAGSIGLLCQLLLTKLLKRQEQIPILRTNAGYTAHTIVALALMVLVSVIGVAGWWCQPLPSTPIGRLIVPMPSVRWLAAVITGMFCLWDIPISIYVKQLRKPDVIIHHIVMAAVSYTAAISLPMHYAFFYLGISELSSIPLLFYDQLSVMTAKISDDEDNNNNNNNKEDKTSESSAAIQKDNNNNYNLFVKLRDLFQPIAAVAFTWIRAILFTKITLCNFVPDVLTVLPNSGVLAAPLRFALISSIGFTILQLYWFSMIVRVVLSGEK